MLRFRMQSRWNGRRRNRDGMLRFRMQTERPTDKPTPVIQRQRPPSRSEALIEVKALELRVALVPIISIRRIPRRPALAGGARVCNPEGRHATITTVVGGRQRGGAQFY